MKRERVSSSSSQKRVAATTTVRALERLFLFALGAVAMLFAQLHAKHRETISVVAEASSYSSSSSSLRRGGPKSPLRIVRRGKGEEARDATKIVVDDASSSMKTRSFWSTNISADEAKQKAIREAMADAFEKYEQFAFGADCLMPLKKVGKNNLGGVSATVVDSADTLKIMGLDEHYEQAKRHVLEEADAGLRRLAKRELDHGVSVFETNIRVLGGLLSMYDLTQEKKFLKRAEQVAEALSPAFETKTGVPYTMINPKTKKGEFFGFNDNKAVLADAGSMELEFFTLAARTNNTKWYNYAKKTMDVILSYKPKDPSSMNSPAGLYPLTIDVWTGKFSSKEVYTMGALADSFYEYLIKSWRAFPNARRRDRYKAKFDESMNSVLKFMVTKHEKLKWDNGKIVEDVWFLNIIENGRLRQQMEHLTCFISGALVLGAEDAETEALAQSYLKLAKHLTALCREFYVAQKSGLGPEEIAHDGNRIFSTDNQNKQRPEVVEAIFYMYRKTGDEKYREWSWEIFQAMKRGYRIETGWTAVNDVRHKVIYNPNREDIMNSFFLSETLKYLYLTFGSSNEIDLSEWVFNTEAHPVKLSPEFEHSF